jgi:hypothetical protein
VDYGYYNANGRRPTPASNATTLVSSFPPFFFPVFLLTLMFRLSVNDVKARLIALDLKLCREEHRLQGLQLFSGTKEREKVESEHVDVSKLLGVEVNLGSDCVEGEVVPEFSSVQDLEKRAVKELSFIVCGLQTVLRVLFDSESSFNQTCTLTFKKDSKGNFFFVEAGILNFEMNVAITSPSTDRGKGVEKTLTLEIFRGGRKCGSRKVFLWSDKIARRKQDASRSSETPPKSENKPSDIVQVKVTEKFAPPHFYFELGGPSAMEIDPCMFCENDCRCHSDRAIFDGSSCQFDADDEQECRDCLLCEGDCRCKDLAIFDGSSWQFDASNGMEEQRDARKRPFAFL